MRILAYVITCTILALSAPEASADKRPRVLLLTGIGSDGGSSYPDWRHQFYNNEIAEILQDLVRVDITEDLSRLNREQLADYRLIINNSVILAPSREQLDAFYQFVASGNAYLALHSGLASFLNSERYPQMMGGRFVGANNLREFEVFTFDSWYGYDYNQQQQHPITRGMPNFRVRDELYIVQTNTPDLEVIARGENLPLLWWHPWENGKAMGLTLGHDLETIENPGYRQLLRNSVRWLVGYPIVEPIAESVFPTGAGEVKDYLDLNAISHGPDGQPLQFRVLDNSNPQLVSVHIDRDNRAQLNFVPGSRGSATVYLEARGGNGLTTISELQLSVREKGSGNLAQFHGVTVQASASEPRKYTADPRYLIDGNLETRWSSDYRDDNWIYLDLGESQTVNRVKLLWEGAFGRAYDIQVSNDAQQWTTVFSRADGSGGTEDIQFDPVPARYVRLDGRERATRWGYSLYQFEVYGEE